MQRYGDRKFRRFFIMNIHEKKKSPVVWVLVGSISILLLSMDIADFRRMIDLTANLTLIILISYFWYLMGPIIGLGILALVDSKRSTKWANKMVFKLPKLILTREFLVTYSIATVYFIVVYCFWMIVTYHSDLNVRVLYTIADLTFCIVPVIGLFLASKSHIV